MEAKSQQLQIRVSPQQKAALKRLAGGAGVSISHYVLSRALPPARARLRRIVEALHTDDAPRFALADLNDLLTETPSDQFSDLVSDCDVTGLPPRLQNYVAAMVEQAAHQKGTMPPLWTRRIEPLSEPYFAGRLVGLRPYLLRAAPVAFKRRNLFVDSGPGDRV